jgi:hypothetical protein
LGRDNVKQLAALGFNRMSVGVQDFSPEVQVAVNRVQSLDETRLVIDAAREFGFKGISVGPDLRPAQAERDQLQPYAGRGHQARSGSPLDLQLRASAQPGQAAAAHQRSRPSPHPISACKSCNWRSAA